MKILFTLLALCFALNAHAATYLLLSQTNAFAAGITNEAKAYTDAHSGGGGLWTNNAGSLEAVDPTLNLLLANGTVGNMSITPFGSKILTLNNANLNEVITVNGTGATGHGLYRMLEDASVVQVWTSDGGAPTAGAAFLGGSADYSTPSAQNFTGVRIILHDAQLTNNLGNASSAIYGTSELSSPGSGYFPFSFDGQVGVEGEISSTSPSVSTGSGYGLLGLADSTLSFQSAILGVAMPGGTGTTNIGVIGSVVGGSPSGKVYAPGYFEAAISDISFPNLTSSILTIDSRDSGFPLITARTNNGTIVFQVPSDGSITTGGNTNRWSFADWPNVTVDGSSHTFAAGTGNMVNTGASVVGMVPVYTDASGTALTPTNSIDISSVNAGTLYLSNMVANIVPVFDGNTNLVPSATSTNDLNAIAGKATILGHYMGTDTNALLAAIGGASLSGATFIGDLLVGTTNIIGELASKGSSSSKPQSIFALLSVNFNNTSANYCGITGGSSTTTLGVGTNYNIYPTSAVLSNLFVSIESSVGAGTNITFTIYTNGAASAVTATIPGGSVTASDLTHTCDVAQGTRMNMVIQANNAGVGNTRYGWSFLAY